jgi:membrane protein
MSDNVRLRGRDSVQARLDAALWRPNGAQLSPWKRALLHVGRIGYVLGRDLMGGALTLRAMGLVYTTLLSFVPLLALSFSVLKGFGVHNQFEPMLATFLAPLGERGDEITQRILGFIENVNVGVLGAAGLGLLIYTVVSLMQKIEESFNFIWHVSHSRGFSERFARYLSVLLIGPLLVFSAMGITATVMNNAWVRSALEWRVLEPLTGLAGELMPYVLVVVAFTFIYAFVPNTRVRAGPALAGGLAGGILWQSAGWGFAAFIASSTRYSAIYSGFAIVILFMIWLYLSWLIVLFGASVAFYAQHPHYLLPLGGEPRLSNRMRERLAVAVALETGRAFEQGRPGPTLEQLGDALAVPQHAIQRVLDAMMHAGLMVLSADRRYVPGRDPHGISVHELLKVVRADGESRYVNRESVPLPPAVEHLLERREAQSMEVLGAVSLASLAASGGRNGTGATARSLPSLDPGVPS